MKTTSISRVLFHAWRSALDMFGDRRGIAATEFAVIVPIMLVMFFGTIEFSSGVAADRDVTLMARTFSDLTSQSTSVADSDLTNFATASVAILWPYSSPPYSQPTNATISELYVDPSTLQARVQWSRAATITTSGSVVLVAGRAVSSVVAIPTQLAVGGTYLLFSEVNYQYVPTVGYVMAKAGVTLSDFAYTRPRQSTCVIYPTPTSGSLPACPTL
jgi:Flp pilus assembly protein TadG